MSELPSSGWISTVDNIKHLAAKNPYVKPLATVSRAKKLYPRSRTLQEWERKYQYTITDLISRKKNQKANKNNLVNKSYHEIVKKVGNTRHGSTGTHPFQDNISEKEDSQTLILQTKLASEKKSSCLKNTQEKVYSKTESLMLKVGMQPTVRFEESKLTTEDKNISIEKVQEQNVSLKTKLDITQVQNQPLMSVDYGSTAQVSSSRSKFTDPTITKQVMSNILNSNKENNREILLTRQDCLEVKVVASSVLQKKDHSFCLYNCDQLFFFQRPQTPRLPLKERLSRV